MPNFIISPNMNLTVPNVGQDPGPDYAFNVNTSLTLIDRHDHTSGNGVQITPLGMDINTNLDFHDNFVINLAGTTMLAQGSTPTNGTVYISGVDLFFTDLSGNNIRLTQTGAVAGTPGSITNLTSPASASYVAASKTFVWQSNVNIAANLDAASLLLRNISPNSTFAVTLNPPAALGSNYSLTLPTIPGSSLFLTIDTSGNIGTANSIQGTQIANQSLTGSQLVNNTVTRTQLATVGQTSSSSSGNAFTQANGSMVYVSQPFTATISIGAGALVATTITSPITVYNNQVVHFTTTGSLPTGITANTNYFIINVSGSSGAVTFNLATTPNGSPITTSGTQSGTQTVHVHPLSFTVTTTGRPVIIMLVPDGSNLGFIGAGAGTSSDNALLTQILNNGSIIAYTETEITNATSWVFPPGSIWTMDTTVATGSPGTYTYDMKFEYSTGSGSPLDAFINDCRLIAYEL